MGFSSQNAGWWDGRRFCGIFKQKAGWLVTVHLKPFYVVEFTLWQDEFSFCSKGVHLAITAALNTPPWPVVLTKHHPPLLHVFRIREVCLHVILSLEQRVRKERNVGIGVDVAGKEK